MDTGYSGKTLREKLGIKAGMRAHFVHAPEGYIDAVVPGEVILMSALRSGLEFVQVFVESSGDLRKQLERILPKLQRDGMVWVSWPKKAAAKKLGIETDLTEDVVREVALPLGLVDVKVCAVDEVWSGLKLVIRKELR
jgi:hypothetical protein